MDTISAQHAKKSELKSPAVESYGVRNFTPQLVIPETIFRKMTPGPKFRGISEIRGVFLSMHIFLKPWEGF